MKKTERNINAHFMVSKEEREIIRQRMKMTGITSLRAYLLKMALNGHIYTIELDSVQEMVRLLSNATNNINQIAKKANETGIVNNDDIEYLTRKIDDIWMQSKKALTAISELIV